MEISTLSVLTFFTAFVLLACASNNNQEKESLDEVAKQIHHEVGNAEADHIEQCQSMPIGVKPAGGPWGYLVYSEKTTDTHKLKELIEHYNELNAELNKREDIMSTADIATPPTLKIVDGRCVGEGHYAWNPGDLYDEEDEQ